VLVGGVPAPRAARPFDASTFRDTVRFLLGFISKDKHTESLADKLLHRLETTAGAAGGDDVHLWRDIAFCLSQLPLNDKMVKRMAEGVRAYRRCLGDGDVWESVSGMLAKAKRAVAGGGAAKGELRLLVDEWEKALGEAHASQAEDDVTASKARAAGRKARRVAAAEGIDAEAIASAAASEAAASVAAAKEADAVAAKAAGRGASSRGKAASPGAPKVRAKPAASKQPKKKRGGDDDDDDEGEDEEGVGGGGAGRAAPAPKRGLRKAATAAVSYADEGGGDDDEEDEEEGGTARARGRAAPTKAPVRGTR